MEATKAPTVDAGVDKAAPKQDARAEYIAQLQKEAALYPSVPDVEVRYDFSYTLQLPVAKVNHEIDTFASRAAATASAPLRLLRGVANKLTGSAGSDTRAFKVLDGVHGVLRPGTMTLLLSPPGHGKTSLLRALSGRLPPSKLEGSLSYSGVPAAELLASKGIHLRLLSSYTGQLDEHLPYLTVRETAAFAYENATVDPALLRGAGGDGGDGDLLEQEAAHRVDRVLKLLSLNNCADTLVGNDLLRGISGGEKKRVTVAESLVSNARLLCMDEISTGLDSSVTYDILASVRAWAQAMRGTVVVALLQPTPECYSLFDEVIMLREGATVYHGPRTALPGYLEGLGYKPPKPAAAPGDGGAPTSPALGAAPAPGADGVERTTSSSGSAGEGGDMADWLTEFLTFPLKTAAAGTKATARAAAGLLPSASFNVSARLPGTPEPSALSLASLPAAASSGDLAAADAAAEAAAAKAAEAAAAALARIPTTTAALAAAWRASDLCASAASPSKPAPSLELGSPFAQAQYGRPYPRSPLVHFGSLLKRQVEITVRNKLFMTARLASAIVISLILGSVWWRLGVDDGLEKFGLLLFASLQIAFANFSEVPHAVTFKYVAYKQMSSGMYPEMAYALAAALVHLPVAIAETLIFSSILYFMTGLAEEGARWAYFFGMLLLVNIAMASMFRIFAYGLPDLEAAQTAPGPIVSVQVIFAGFLVTYNNMGWLQFMYYLSVFGYALKGLALNEFNADVYRHPVPVNSTAFLLWAAANNNTNPAAACASGTGVPCEPLGDVYLGYLDLTTDLAWMWGSLGFIAGFAVLMTLCSGLVLSCVKIERNVGSSRLADGADAATATAVGDAAAVTVPGTPLAATPAAVGGSGTGDSTPSKKTLTVATTVIPVDVEAAGGVVPTQANPMARAGSPSSFKVAAAMTAAAPVTGAAAAATSTASVLPFEPMTVAWRDVTYEVNLPKQLGGGKKTLLHGISGFAEPGRMIALMGASGAGKTTLLDVLAGRKNSGRMTGAITLNGHPKEDRSFARLTAYCEQQDIHNAYATVREALEFSAALRLPASVPAATRTAFVGEILDLLELRPLADRKVGEAGAADGLSPGQRKILTIGVELCANAPILFLDEPTSGLDSRAAQMVMRVVRRIANTNRTVVSTIHQPSHELFALFDSLLLLQKGGWMAYFGPARGITRYLRSLPGVAPCPRRMNPASWMLDVLSGSDSSGGSGSDGAGTADPLTLPPASTEVIGIAAYDASGRPVGHGHGFTLRHAHTVEEVPMSPLPDTPTPVAAVSTPAEEAAAEEGGGNDSTPTAVAATAADAAAATRTAAGVSTGKPSSAAAGIPGPLLQERLLASRQWAAATETLGRIMTPAPGSVPYTFASQYPTGFATQVAWVLRRAATTYWRNVNYNYTRWTALVGLNVLFGTIWYKLQGNSVGGVQSLVSVMFMASLFEGMICLNTSIAPGIKNRAVFYRERFSRMYAPEAYALSSFLIELPWLLFICLSTIPIVYFMVGFNSSAGAFFFYLFAVWLLTVLFSSLGQLMAATLSTMEVAQAISGLIIPLLFLFGGLFVTGPSLPSGWYWAYLLDPVKWAITAIVPPQFHNDDCAPNVNCPTVTYYSSTTGLYTTVDTDVYVDSVYGLKYSERWQAIGILIAYTGFFQILHFLATRFVSHINR